MLVCDKDDDLLELMLRRLEGMGLKLDRAVDGATVSARAEYAHILALRYKEPGTSLGAEE